MFPVSSQSRFYLYGSPADMRKSFDGLSGLVTNQMKADPLNGSVYLFVNRVRNRLKMLVWDAGGFWLLCKRLEQGRFQLPEAGQHELDYHTLLMLINGVDYTQIKRKKRYKKMEKELS